MSTRMIRTLAIAAGAGALVLSAAAPAMAADTSIDKLPAKAKIATTEKVNVLIPAANQPVGFVCGTANVTWSARVPGKQDAVLIAPVAPATALTSICDAGNNIALTVSSNSASAKKNAVVKFTGVDTKGTPETTDDTKSVMTLVVKVTGKTGNPGKGNKPA